MTDVTWVGRFFNIQSTKRPTHVTSVMGRPDVTWVGRFVDWILKKRKEMVDNCQEMVKENKKTVKFMLTKIKKLQRKC